jgi:hypothetical protein
MLAKKETLALAVNYDITLNMMSHALNFSLREKRFNGTGQSVLYK